MRNQPFSQIPHTDEPSHGRVENSRRRPLMLTLFMVVVLAIIGVRVVYIQVAIAERYRSPWQELITEEEPLPCRDGRIVSRDGVVLAQDETRYDLAVDYRWMQTPPHPGWLRQQIAQQLPQKQRRDPVLKAAAEEKVLERRRQMVQQLAEVTLISEQQISGKMQAIQKRIEAMQDAVERKRGARRDQLQQQEFDWSAGLQGIWKVVVQELTTAPDRYQSDPIVLKEELQDHLLLSDVSLEIVAAIQSQPSRFPGVRIREASARSYPLGDLAPHLIGVRKPKRSEAVGETQSVRVGESGIERVQASRLDGKPGVMQHVKNRQGERVDSKLIRPPADGRDVVLTIDSRLQQLAEELLDAALDHDAADADQYDAVPVGGTLVAMDVWTGDLLALACSPRPSLRVLARPSVDAWEELQQDPRHPLFPRTTQTALAPGGLFQIVTTAAALDSGAVTAEENFECRGMLPQADEYECQLYRQYGLGHGAITPQDLLSRSCNVFACEMGRRLGLEPLREWSSRFGFGEKTGIDLPGEVAGSLPAPPQAGSQRSIGATLQLANGQGKLLATPLQMARMMAGIANGGYLLQPRVTFEASRSGSTNDSGSRRIEGLSPEILTVLRQGLEDAIESAEGTAQGARIEMMPMAGKSGVAELAGRPGHAWFAGYAPARSPRVAFVVVLEQAGQENAAARIVRDFVTELLGYGYLRPVQDDSRQTSR